MDTGLQGRTAIVTGGGQGIGRGICLRLADEGVRTVIADLDEQMGQGMVREVEDSGGVAKFVRCDVRVAAETIKLATTVTERFGAIDILVNNAGVSLVKPFRELTEAEWDQIVGVNLKGSYLCCSSVLPHMVRQQGGKIVNLSSIAGLYPTAQQTPYCSAKAAVVALTRSLAYEYARYNINVNAICPGIVRTPIWEKVLDDLSFRSGEDREKIWESYLEPVPLKRAQTPEDIGNLVVFLSSELARNITAATISITGGMDSIFFQEE